MRFLPLLLISALSLSADDRSSPERRWVRELIAPAWDHEQLRQQYLRDPSVREEIKQAIEQRVVVTGMCPLDAIAAAGLPLHGAMNYRETVPGAREPFPRHIAAQCGRPDPQTSVQLQFRNDTQFGPGELFRVCFWEGRVVAVDQEKFIPPCWEGI